MVQMTFQNNDVYMAVKVDRYQRNLLAEMWEVSAVCWEIGTLPLWWVVLAVQSSFATVAQFFDRTVHVNYHGAC